jgi:hypothetical protein
MIGKSWFNVPEKKDPRARLKSKDLIYIFIHRKVKSKQSFMRAVIEIHVRVMSALNLTRKGNEGSWTPECNYV